MLNYAKILQREIPVKKTDLEIFYNEIFDEALKEMEGKVDDKIEQIVNELPLGKSSSIAKNIFKETDREKNIIYVFTDNMVWEWLDKGTGVYNPEHAGKGVGGAIVPINAKALHFKNREISVALNFPTEDVYIRSCKGIKPHWFFCRIFNQI